MAEKNLLTRQALIILLRNVLFIEIAISKIFIIESCQTGASKPKSSFLGDTAKGDA